MKISIIGSGYIGGTLARLFVKAGHEVALANSRGPASMQSFANELGTRLHPVKNIDEAIAFSDMIVVAIHWRTIDTLPVFNVQGKIIVDTTNPYKADGTFYDLGDEIPSTRVMKHFTGGMIVKAFNTIWFKHLAENGNKDLPVADRRVIPVAGDDSGAKSKVAGLIEEIGFGSLDTGSLQTGTRFQNVQGPLYNKELTVQEATDIILKIH
jgi:8-hydroxy-5-deazaflavin:NADPH oxidoreductase